MLVPNVDRVLIKPLEASEGQVMQAGEYLFLGEIVHAGDTRFKVGQRVYYSNYSASLIKDFTQNIDLFVIAQDDIMAYEEIA